MFIGKTRFKIASHGRVLLCITAFISSLLAAPQGGVVTSGIADINSAGSTTNINQHSSKAAINWQGFSISPNEAVNFNQPNQNSIILNRVIGNERSIIEGSLNANGKVFLINSNGILFSQSSSVNTAGLIASTLSLSDEDFNSGNLIFQADPNSKSSVINLGTIQIKDEGYASLLGESVINDGVIIANRGTISLNSGDRITLNFNGDSLINVSIDEGTLNSLVENGNAIIADGGVVILTAKSADKLLNSQVNIKGIIQAQSIDDLKGNIYINSYDGETNIDALLDASGLKDDGGFVETSGSKVSISDTALINTKSQDGKTGAWLIDPKDFTVGEDISGLTLSAQLENTNVEIQSTQGNVEGNGDININERVEWSASTTLTLTAENDININNAVLANGDTAGVTLNYGGDYHILTPASFSGAVLDANGLPVAKTDTSGGQYGSISFGGNNAKLIINGQEYTLIYSLSQLDLLDGYDALANTGISTNVNGYYALAHNLDGTGTTYQSSLINSYNGIFTGLGNTIDHLNIVSSAGNIGLFSTANTGTIIRNFGLTNVDVATSGGTAGSLVGTNSGDISNVYATGKVEAAYSVGGLVGLNNGASVLSNLFTDIEALHNAGGLVGEARGSSISIKNSHALGSVSGSESGGLIAFAPAATTIDYSYASVDILSGGGGLIGSNYGPLEITNSFATGDITGGGGGIIGNAYTANTLIKNVYATGDIRGGGGGLIGSVGSALMGSAGTFVIQDVFATGDVYSADSAGGLIGVLNTGATYIIDNAYATGNVYSTAGATDYGSYVGGLIGSSYSGATITNSYATGDVTGGLRTGGLVGFAMGGSISDSWASGNVVGIGESAGGLVGSFNGRIANSYATGDVSGATSVGGLVGLASFGDIFISDSYATGSVAGSIAGGIIGRSTRTVTITNTFYDSDANPNIAIAGDSSGVNVESGGGLSGEEAAFIDIVVKDANLASHFITGRNEANVASTALQRDNNKKTSIQISKNDAYAYGSDITSSIMSNVTITDKYSSDVGNINVEGTTYDVNGEQ